MSQIPMVDLKTQYNHIAEEIDNAIKKVIHSTQFIGGEALSEFKSNLSKYHHNAHVIPCANGTDALQIALMAAGLKPGDEVITTPFTFVATAEVIALLRLEVKFVDVYYDTFNMNIEQLEEARTERTRAVIPVHLFGQCCNMDPINEWAKSHDICVIEDNAQSIGAHYTNHLGTARRSGTLGDMACTSFFPSKNLGAYGDGGAIFTKDDELAEKLSVICNHGSKVRYYHEAIGVNSRLDGIQAAILNVKLKYLDQYNERRNVAAHNYKTLLQDVVEIILPETAEYSDHVYHQFTLKIPNGKRDQVQKHLNSKGIASGVYYPVPLHLQKAYYSPNFPEGSFPISERLALEVLSLPMHTELDMETQSRVVEEIKITL